MGWHPAAPGPSWLPLRTSPWPHQTVGESRAVLSGSSLSLSPANLREALKGGRPHVRSCTVHTVNADPPPPAPFSKHLRSGDSCDARSNPEAGERAGRGQACVNEPVWIRALTPHLKGPELGLQEDTRRPRGDSRSHPRGTVTHGFPMRLTQPWSVRLARPR